MSEMDTYVNQKINELFEDWAKQKDAELAVLQKKFGEHFSDLQKQRKAQIAFTARHAKQVEGYLKGFNKLLRTKK